MILVAFDDEFCAYQGAMAATIRIFYPHAEVKTTDPDALQEEVEHFGPRVVVSISPRIPSSYGVSAWIELSVYPTRPTKIHVGERYSEVVNPKLETLLVVIDEFEQPGQRTATSETARALLHKEA